MLGAILVAGFVAIISSTLATFNNLAVSKKFPGLEWEITPDLAEDVFMRIVCYRLVARLFYMQALFFWAIFVVLVIAKLLGLE
jgi:hypothetical protein